ncbi:hypothetical protein SprV_0501903500 [Sparganum proliferum]
MWVLWHEASFNTADAKPVNMIAAVESILSQTGATDETKNHIRHQVSSLLMAHRPRDVLSKVERDAHKETQGRQRPRYRACGQGAFNGRIGQGRLQSKSQSLLEDRQSYVQWESNPMKTLTREINATLLAMENSGCNIANRPTHGESTRNGPSPILRFPKVHIEGAPLRPIVSLKGTPTYELAKWLFQRLKFSDLRFEHHSQHVNAILGEA